MIYKKTMNSKRFVEFVYRLYKNNEHKILVILDNLAVHHSKHFEGWLKNKNDKVEIFYLPAYSLKIKQDERLDRDLKTNFHFSFSIKNNDDFRKKNITFLRMIQRFPDRVKILFQNWYDMSYRATI